MKKLQLLMLLAVGTVSMQQISICSDNSQAEIGVGGDKEGKLEEQARAVAMAAYTTAKNAGKSDADAQAAAKVAVTQYVNSF